jgi:hypothetical protein
MPYDGYPDERGLRYPVAFAYSVIVALFWAPAFILRRVSRFLRETGTDSWPRANGSITSGNVKVIRGWVIDYALGRLDYSYRVAGDYYAGSIIRQYPDEQAAWDFVDARRASHVVVRYRDDNAQASALRDDDQELSWTAGTELGFFAAVWRHWRDELRDEPQGLPADEGLLRDDEDEKVNHGDQVGR